MVPLILSVELHRVVAVDDIEQVYIVTPIHSFLSTIESINYSSGLNNVSIVETVLKVINKNNTLVETIVLIKLF